MNDKHIYIVATQTGTILSRILKLITKAPYNHSSISLEDDLHELYSFGRINPYNPFIGGFIKESPQSGTFKRFNKTQAYVIQIDVDAKTYYRSKHILEQMYHQRDEYAYNYKGLFLAGVQIPYWHENTFYCSEFVRDFLYRVQIEKPNTFPKIVKPQDFINQYNHNCIYQGNLQDYSVKNQTIYK